MKRYKQYLQSEEWKKKRQKILLRDECKCKRCGNQAEQVHHKNYDYIGTEKEKEFCESLCTDCHQKSHDFLFKHECENCKRRFTEDEMDYDDNGKYLCNECEQLTWSDKEV